MLNDGFTMLMPFNLNIKKYVDMLHVMESKDTLLNFLRMEKWIFDSPGQAGECLRQFVNDLYKGNKLVKGTLKLGGKTVNLGNITMPILTIFGSADHLVPPAATKPINDLVGTKDKTLYEFKGGHIGVFVGARSQKELAPAIAKWLVTRDVSAPLKTKETPKKTPAAAIEKPVAAVTEAAKPAVAKPAPKKAPVAKATTAKAAPAKATKAKAAAKPKAVTPSAVPEVFKATFKKPAK
jgi:poly(3-hydroxyalkanoate) synthetase